MLFLGSLRGDALEGLAEGFFHEDWAAGGLEGRSQRSFVGLERNGRTFQQTLLIVTKILLLVFLQVYSD